MFDYERPGRLLELRVPGEVSFDTGHPRAVSAAEDARPRLGDVDAAVLDALIGADLRAQLEAGAEFNGSLKPAVSWVRAGRLALLQTVLRDLSRPLDGLWAAEAAAIAAGLGVTGLDGWVRELVETAAPALRLLPESWAGSDNVPGGLRGVLVACSHARADLDLGALAKALQDLDDVAVLEAAEMVIERALSEALDGWDPTAEADLVGSATVVRAETRSGRRAEIDHTANDTVRSAEWSLHDGELTVSGVPESKDWPESFASRVQVRATTRSTGMLVAAGMGVSATREGWQTTLRLPFRVDPDDLFVCVGRHLPVEAMGPQVFTPRQACRYRRDRLVNTGGRPLFLAEQVGRLIDVNQLDEQLGAEPDERGLRAARSIAWCSTTPAAAARYERRRLTTTDAGAELSLEQTDRLIAAAVQHDDTDVAAELDRRATDAYYELIA